MKFTKEEVEALRRLLDVLVDMTELEPDEVIATNKMYDFLKEQEC